MRGTTEALARGGSRYEISIHVPREGDDLMAAQSLKNRSISIHVPREGDDWADRMLLEYETISIHVPREGDDSPPQTE